MATSASSASALPSISSSDASSNGKRKADPRMVKALRSLAVASSQIMSRRRNLSSEIDGPTRDLDEDCGYPKTGELDAKYYQELFDREPLAARVVEVMAKESWQVQPRVYEVNDPSKRTPFEDDWDNLGRSLRGKSYYQDEQGSPIWEYLLRADILSGIGHYGVLLFGFDDLRAGESLETPVTPQPLRKLLYLRVFPESQAAIAAREVDPISPRYGQPTYYNITFDDPQTASPGGFGASSSTRKVHWTRIQHLADELESSEIFARPRMRPVLNPLLDIRKVRGGSAEMYWQGALPGLSIETLPQLGGDVEIDEDAMRDMMEDYINGLQRYIGLQGQTARVLSPTVVDPTGQLKVQIDAICIKLGIPVRIFMGSERGELASSQDDDAWNDRVIAREYNYLTPRVVVPFVDRLIWAGCLRPPTGFSVEWPDITSRSEAEEATVGLTLTQALATYVGSGAMSLVPPIDFLTRLLKMSDEDALAILDKASEQSEQVGDTGGTPSPLLGLVGGIGAMIELFKMAKEGGLTEEQLKQQIMLFFKVSDEQATALISEGLATPTTPSLPGSPDPTTRAQDPVLRTSDTKGAL